MSFDPVACTSCGQLLRPTAQFCDACGASARPAARPAEAVQPVARPVAPPRARPSPLPILAAVAALVVLIAGIVVWRTRDRAPEPAPVAQRTERPPGMSGEPPADVGTSDGPADVADEAGRDEVVDVPPDEPSPLPPRVQAPPRVESLPPPPPVEREIVVATPPSAPSPETVSGPPMLPPTRRDPPAPPPPAPDVDDGPLWEAYASARANAASPGTKDPAIMRSKFCAAAARTLRDGQGRDVGRIRSDQRRFGC